MSIQDTAASPTYEDTGGLAPIVHFDLALAHGVFNGSIEIETANRILIPTLEGGGVTVKYITAARLRCSPAGAVSLRDAIDAALKMLEQPQQGPAAASKLN